jgi:carbonic anhydrase
MTHVAPARHWQHSLQRLKDGNQRFQQQNMNHILQHNLDAMLQGQAPHAAIVSCSDSRVSPDIIFDCSLGDLFIIQNAGNVCDASVLGSIQYAVQTLEIPLIVVIGHTGCGAVSAAYEGATLEGPLKQLVACISPHLLEHSLQASIEHHALQTAEMIAQALLPHQAQIIPELKIIAGLYHLDSGAVEWLEHSSTEQDLHSFNGTALNI